MATTVAAVVFDSPMIARIEHRHSKRALVSDVERPILPQIQRYGIWTIGVNRQISLFVARDCWTRRVIIGLAAPT